MTDPVEPNTFPNLTVIKLVLCFSLSKFCIYISAALLEAPIKLVGSTALSVETNTIILDLNLITFSAIILVPNILVLIASDGCCSHIGTCFNAAACNTISGLFLLKVFSTALLSLISSNIDNIFFSLIFAKILSVIFHKAYSE